ncbi:phosphoethanolamine transferase [Hydrocarboniphaga sp.]|uniref:phosphoethanolamine transferase n=1 Tax=Hydrocarboniphaga sp. TaxID=2033016 RepID=UPI003D14455B
MPRPRLSAGQLLLLVALYLSTTQNASFWQVAFNSLAHLQGTSKWLFLGVLALVLNAALLFCLGLLTPRIILKPMLSALLLIAAVCSYFMDSFHVVVDLPMMTNVVQTDARESAELLGRAWWLHLALYGLLPVALIWWTRIVSAGAVREIGRRVVLLAVALAVVAGAVGLDYKNVSLWARENEHIRTFINPSYPIYSAARLISEQLQDLHPPPVVTTLPGASRVATERPLLVVLVVGETARAANFQLNGYERATNPELAAIPDLINFGQTVSCGTSTAISVPCMFSDLGRKRFSKERAERQENLLDVLARVGVDVHWLDNDSGCKGVCARVAYQDRSRETDAALCQDDNCYDGVLFKDLQTLWPRGALSRLVVLHQKGSHGPSYYRRYPAEFRRFLPACELDDVQTCSREQIVNAYDNTILYTDHLLAGLITELRGQQQFDSVVLYLSDHGESLGEDGVYLHGLPYAVAPMMQKHVPMLAWFSERALLRQRLDPACLKAASAQPHSQDDLFDTMLGLFGVRAPDYQGAANLFAGCASP